ncbi:MAG: IS4 family transposase [Leptolyngbyaceae cyanobacterium]
MRDYRSINIRQISQSRAEQVGYYRFLNNDNVTVSELGRSLADRCGQQVADLHVLSISDTSEINLQAHVGRLKPDGLGVVGNNHDVGFFIHPSLALNAANGCPLGISHVQMWTRAAERPDKHERGYASLPIEQKESYKWLQSAEGSARCLLAGGARKITHIGDRESDIYEEWARVPDAENHLLVRVRADRCLRGCSASLYRYLAEQPCEGTYTVDVPADSRIDRRAREAWMAVRFTPLEIQRPANVSATEYPPGVQLYAVEAKEVNPPADQEAIHWRLLTTHCVMTLEQALQVIGWYRWRWQIELLFATLKTAGLDIESSELESVGAIQRLTVLALSVAVQILQLVEGREQPELTASLTFSADQQQCLEQIAPSLEGTTEKQQNPYPIGSLAWASWVIARLGGWSGYQSQRPPGIRTLARGLREFEAMFRGWKLLQPPLVCTP